MREKKFFQDCLCRQKGGRKESTMGENAEKGKLSRADLFSMATGQIIGVGIMTMTGIAIGYTGRSVNIAYIIAGIITIIGMIPQIYIGGTANFLGGQYSQIAVLSGQRMAGIYLYIQLFSALAISMYALSFADYFLSLFPWVNTKLVCVIVLTVLFGMHVIGVKQAAQADSFWPPSTLPLRRAVRSML